jgi:DNA-binding response OmpR family regulator
MTGPVLIIEDNVDIAEILRYALEKENYETRVALTGEEGLYASLDKLNPPSIILLDLLLPGMSGFELCRRIRGEQLTKTTPILIITAKPVHTELSTFLELGADDVITKPFVVSSVVTKVNSLVKR